jgi:DNA-binding transcriptional MocR family regulator
LFFILFISCSPEINKALVQLSRKYELLIVCDDVYNLLAFEAPAPKRLFAYDRIDDDDFQGNVISNGTLSKILAPGIRVGWMECPPKIVEAFRNSGVLKSGGAINNYVSGIVSSMIEMGLVEKQFKKSLETYRIQCVTLCETLDLYLPKGCKFNKPKGGYFVWIELPEGCNGDELSHYCFKQFKVFAIRGSRFSVENKFKNFIRLTFAFHSEQLLREGAKRLCNGIASFIAENNM